MSIKLHRFDFGTLRDFRAPFVPADTAEDIFVEVAPLPPPPPVFDENDLELAKTAAHKIGYAEGFDAGLSRAAQQADAKREAVEANVMKLGEMVAAQQQTYQALLHKEAESLSEMIRLIAQKVAGVALDARGHETIVALVTQCLPVILSKPRLIVELNPNAFEATVDHIESLLHANGFEGEIQFRANSALAVHDVTLDWGAGQASRNTEALWQEIQVLLSSMPITITPTSVETAISPSPNEPTPPII